MSWQAVGRFLKSKWVLEQSPIVLIAVLILGGLAQLVFDSFPEERRETREWMGQLNDKNQAYLTTLVSEFRDETKEMRVTFDGVYKSERDRYDRLFESMLKINQQQAQTQTMNIGQPDQEKLIREGRDKIISEWTNAIVRRNSSGPGRSSDITADAAVGLRDETDAGVHRTGSGDSGDERSTSGDSTAGGVADGKVPTPTAMPVSETLP